jgi:hypothetical protein
VILLTPNSPKPLTLWAAFSVCAHYGKSTDTPITFPPAGDIAMLMIYDYRVTVRHDDSPQQTDTFDHAIVADTNDHRGTVLRQSLEDVDGCVIVRATLLSARSLTLHELGLLDRTTLKVHPIPGIRLTRRISQPPTGSWTTWSPRILSIRELVSMDEGRRDEHDIDLLFPGQFCTNHAAATPSRRD